MVYSALSDSTTTSQFTRRKKIHINSSADGALTDYQIKLTITHEAAMQADFDDVRFSESDGSYIYYWLESKTDSTTADIWMKTDVPASGGKDIFMYYGSPTVSDNNDIYNTFMFGDDFSDGTYTNDPTIANFGNWQNNRASDVVGNYAYVTEWNGMHVVDISTITSPNVVGYIALGNQTLDIEVRGNYAYVGVLTDNKLCVVDISTPASPSLTGSVTDSTKLNQVHGIAKEGDYVYCCAYAAGGSTGHFTIVDVSTPASPTIRGSIANDGNNYMKGCHDVQVVGNYAYIISSDHHVDTDGRFVIVNVADKDNPYVVSSLTGTEYHRSADIQIKGNYAYFGQWGYPHDNPQHRYIRVIDISNVNSPSLVGGLAGYNMYIGYIEGDLLYGVDSRFDIVVVVDISDPTNPKYIKEYHIPGETAVLHVSLTDDGRYGIIARYNGSSGEKFYIIDTEETPSYHWSEIDTQSGDTISAATNKLVMTKGSNAGYFQYMRETVTCTSKSIWEFLVEYPSGQRQNLLLNGDNDNTSSGAIYLSFDTNGIRYYSTGWNTIAIMNADTEYKIKLIIDASTDTFDLYGYIDNVEISYSGSHTSLAFRNNATYINQWRPQIYSANVNSGILDEFKIREYTLNEPTISIGTEQHQRRIPMFV